jgi:hypothetical protein
MFPYILVFSSFVCLVWFWFLALNSVFFQIGVRACTPMQIGLRAGKPIFCGGKPCTVACLPASQGYTP